MGMRTMLKKYGWCVGVQTHIRNIAQISSYQNI